jgi:TolB-like protein
MIWPLLLALAVQTAPATPATPTRVLVLDLAREGDVAVGVVENVTALVSANLATYPELDVVANADVRQMMALEGTKQEMGCGDTSCLAELAGALGARFVVFGSVGRLGTKTILHINLFDSSTTQSTGREFVEVTDPGELPAVLPPHIRKLLTRTYAELGFTLPPERVAVVAAPVERSPLPMVLVGGGAAAVVVGGIVAAVGALPRLEYASELANYKNATDTATAVAARDAAVRDASDWNTWGAALAVTGGVVGVAGVVGAVIGAVGLVGGGE